MQEHVKLVRAVLISFVLVSAIGTVRAHGSGSFLLGGLSVGFTAVLFVSVALCLLSGFLSLRCSSLIKRSLPVALHSVVGCLLLLLGVSFMIPATLGHPMIGGLGTLSGCLLVMGVSGRSTKLQHHHADLTTGAIFSHRTLEGVLLATIYSTDLAIGIFGALILTGHAIVETVTVCGVYPDKSTTHAFGAIVLLQVGYVGGAIFGMYSSTVISEPIRNVLLAIAGGAVFVIGIAELRD